MDVESQPAESESDSSTFKRWGIRQLNTAGSVISNPKLLGELGRTLVALLVFTAITLMMMMAQMSSDKWYDEYNRQLSLQKIEIRNSGSAGVAAQVFNLDSLPIYATDPLHDRIFDLLPNLSRMRGWLPDLLLSTLIGTCILVNILWVRKPILPFQSLVVLRRMLWILSLLYLFRTVSFMVTTVPSPLPQCVPKYTYGGDVEGYLKMVGGMVAGKVSSCTDNIYSGHTALATVLFFTFVTYAWHWAFKIYAFLHALGVVMGLLLTRLHYSIDIIMALFMASFIFATFHFLLGFAVDEQLLADTHIIPDTPLRQALQRERIIANRLLSSRFAKYIGWLDGLDLRLPR